MVLSRPQVPASWGGLLRPPRGADNYAILRWYVG